MTNDDSGTETSVGCRVDIVTLQRSRPNWETEDGVPITISTEMGEMVPKEVHRETLECPCGGELRYDEKKDAVCQKCGFVNPSGTEGFAGLDFSYKEELHLSSGESYD